MALIEHEQSRLMIWLGLDAVSIYKTSIAGATLLALLHPIAVLSDGALNAQNVHYRRRVRM